MEAAFVILEIFFIIPIVIATIALTVLAVIAVWEMLHDD